MPYPRRHTYVTWFGDGFSQQEEWQVGLRLDGTSTPSDEQLEDLAELFTTLMNTPSVLLPGGRRILGVKVAPIGTNGKYPEGEDAREYLLPVPFEGPANTTYPQIALVVSWRTARTRGYASNGRMYLPSQLAITSTNGQISAGDAQQVTIAAADFIAGVNAVGLGPACVMSTVGAGRIQPITGVRVGRIMDTQRRRRDQLPESYSEVVSVPS